jgi:hypothetical protein
MALAFAGLAPVSASETGVPVSLTISPSTARQPEDKPITPLTATVVLAAPSPAFFICNVRSENPAEVSFDRILFIKGQLRGTAPGRVSWGSVMEDGPVKVAAFSVNDPSIKIWFSVNLKVGGE